MEKPKHFITKHDSSVLYGIAILMMIFHHCFYNPAEMNYDYVPFISFEFEARVAWIGRLCVAIYSFITGYALAKKASYNSEQSFLIHVKYDLTIVIKHLVKFYSKFWLVFVVYVPIGFLLGKSWSVWNLFKGLLFGWAGICGAWWYVVTRRIVVGEKCILKSTVEVLQKCS